MPVLPWPVDDLDDALTASATDLAATIRSGARSAAEIVDAHIARIERVNPHINAVVGPIFDDARRLADDADRRVREDGPDDLSPFHGVPCTVKENYSVTGLPNTGGLVSRKHTVAARDATLVSRMRAAGFIVLGTTNVPEGMMWFESYNCIYGRTTNAYSTAHTSGGSSGGEGAIIGAGGSPIGIGGDVGGSIRNPAFFNGVVGHKPSAGVLPDTGTFPGGKGMIRRYKVVGPLGRTVEDVAALMPLLAGPDGEDPSVDAPAWSTAPLPPPEEIPVYWHEDIGPMSPVDETVRNLRDTVTELEALGHPVERWRPSGTSKALEMWATSLGEAGGHSFLEVLGNLGESEVSLVREWLRWPRGRSAHILPSLVLATLERAMHALEPLLPRRSNTLRQEMRAELEARLGPHGVWVTPTFHRPAPRHGLECVIHTLGFVNCGMLNPLEVPSTAVPTGFSTEGLPLGVQVASTCHNDRLTLHVAGEIEAAFGGWTPPELVTRARS